MHAKYLPIDSNDFSQQHTTDTVLPGEPTLEDLGVTPRWKTRCHES